MNFANVTLVSDDKVGKKLYLKGWDEGWEQGLDIFRKCNIG